MGRNFGLSETAIYYSEQDFKDGCFFNLCMGVGIGVAATIISGLLALYFVGWIW